MNLPRYGYVMRPHPHPCLRTCIPFTHFSLGPSLKKWVVHPHSGSGPAHIMISSLLLQLRNETRCAPSNHIIVEKAWPNRKETLIISVKLQPNVIHSQLDVISVRNRIALLHQTYMKDKTCVDQQTINAWWIRPCMPLKLYIVYMYSDAEDAEDCVAKFTSLVRARD